MALRAADEASEKITHRCCLASRFYQGRPRGHVERFTDPRQQIVVICNFTPVPRLGYRVGLPLDGGYSVILNSDDGQYGGRKCSRIRGISASANCVWRLLWMI